MKKILKEIEPDQEEKERLEKVSEMLKERAEDASSDLNFDIEPMLVGSAARETWVSGEQDIDLFLLFPKHINKEKLENIGLKLGNKITKGKGKEQYAEHPYTNANIEGFDVDIVPCYDIENPSKLKSSVDRTPHHQKFVRENLKKKQKQEVLLLKQFLKGIEAYGSQLKIHGFSGYLCELLVIKYKTFKNIINSAKNWEDEKVIRLKDDERSNNDLKKIFPNNPLVLIDPVDDKRNVAAALSKKNYAKFVRACEEFSKKPSKKFFFKETKKRNKSEIKSLIEKRETEIFLITFELEENLVPDILYPQLRKTEKKIKKYLDRKNFKTLRSEVWSKHKKSAIVIELEYSKLSNVKKHIGPPLGIDSKPFIEKHQNSKSKVAGPYINEEGRLIFELEKEDKKAIEVLKKILESKEGFGKHISKGIEKNGYELQKGKKIADKIDKLSANSFLANYLEKRVPWPY